MGYPPGAGAQLAACLETEGYISVVSCIVGLAILCHSAAINGRTWKHTRWETEVAASSLLVGGATLIIGIQHQNILSACRRSCKDNVPYLHRCCGFLAEHMHVCGLVLVTSSQRYQRLTLLMVAHKRRGPANSTSWALIIRRLCLKL